MLPTHNAQINTSALVLPFASWQTLRLFPWTPFWPFPCHHLTSLCKWKQRAHRNIALHMILA